MNLTIAGVDTHTRDGLMRRVFVVCKTSASECSALAQESGTLSSLALNEKLGNFSVGSSFLAVKVRAEMHTKHTR